jgi:predicted nuclease of predicted toxin-antitoxin system
VRPRFQTDSDFRIEIVDGLSRLDPRIECLTADEAGLRGVPDPRVLSAAAENNRILITHDRRTMPVHFGAFIQKRDCPGVIVIAQNVSTRTAIEELYLIWMVDEHEDYRNGIVDISF